MIIEQKLENKLIELENKINALEIDNQALDREISAFLEGEQVSEEQLSTFVNDAQYFSQKEWDTLLIEKQKLDQKLNCELSQLVSPLKSKKKREELRAASQWLFVR